MVPGPSPVGLSRDTSSCPETRERSHTGAPPLLAGAGTLLQAAKSGGQQEEGTSGGDENSLRRVNRGILEDIRIKQNKWRWNGKQGTKDARCVVLKIQMNVYEE